MAFSLDQVQDDILEYLEGELVQPVIEQDIPTTETVRRVEGGAIEPYVALQFGDLQPFPQGRSFAGPRGDDYWMGVYFQVVGPTPKIARKLANRLVDVFLGQQFDWAGSVRKRSGYGMFPIANNGNVEAYEFPVFFQIQVQISNEA